MKRLIEELSIIYLKKLASLKGCKSASKFPSRDEHVDIVGTFIGVHDLHVPHSFDNVVVQDNSVATEAFTCNGASLSSKSRCIGFGAGNLTNSAGAKVELLAHAGQVGDCEL